MGKKTENGEQVKHFHKICPPFGSGRLRVRSIKDFHKARLMKRELKVLKSRKVDT